MDLKRLAGERLLKMLQDGTGHPPKNWTTEERALQARIAKILGVDPSSLSKAIVKESIALEFISKVSKATGVKATYFVDTSVPSHAITYRDYLTRADPFADVREDEPPPPTDGGGTDDNVAGLLRQAQAMMAKAIELSGAPRGDEALTTAVRRGAHGDVPQGRAAPSQPDGYRSPSDRPRRRRDTESGGGKHRHS